MGRDLADWNDRHDRLEMSDLRSSSMKVARIRARHQRKLRKRARAFERRFARAAAALASRDQGTAYVVAGAPVRRGELVVLRPDGYVEAASAARGGSRVGIGIVDNVYFESSVAIVDFSAGRPYPRRLARLVKPPSS